MIVAPFFVFLAANQRRTWPQASSAGDQRSAEVFVATNQQEQIRKFSEMGGFKIGKLISQLIANKH